MIQKETSHENECMNSVAEPSSRLDEGLSSSLTQVWLSSWEALEAQLSISAIKIVRMAVIVAGGVVALIALIAVAAYAFFLLDGCLNYALNSLDYPIWFAPLVRGLTYLLCSMAGLAYLWHTMVGFGQVTEKGAAHSAILQK